MWKLRVLISTLLALLAVAVCAQEYSPGPYITVAGHAETYVEPDIAVWSVRIEKIGSDLGELQRDCDAELDLLIETVGAVGIPGELITSGRITVQKEYERKKHGERGDFSHYVLARQVEFKQEDVSQYEELLRRLMSDANIAATPRFRFSAEDSIRTEVHLAAVENAKVKAGAMASVLGSRVGRPLIVSEYPILTDYQRVESLSYERGIIERAKPQRVKFKSTVYVRFSLEPGDAGS